MGCDTSADNLSDSSCSFFDDSDYFGSSDDIFSLLESLDHDGHHMDDHLQDNHLLLIPSPSPSPSPSPRPLVDPKEAAGTNNFFGSPPTTSCKRQKVSSSTVSPSLPDNIDQDGEQRMAHITVERNRRKQMNHHLNVLRSLMPSFYVKRGDQASIIGGVIDYINELQQVLQSLEAKKQRKVIYTEVLSPRLLPSPRPIGVGVLPTNTVLSPRKPPLSPRVGLPISPRTPQPTSPYQLKSSPLIIPPPPPIGANYPHLSTLHEPAPPLPSPSNSVSSSQVVVIDNSVCVNQLAASSKSNIADVEVKFSNQNNLLLKTTSPKIPGQAVKIISALESLALEILHVSVTTIEETMLNSFTIKIGIECQLSAEELAQQIQQTFC